MGPERREPEAGRGGRAEPGGRPAEVEAQLCGERPRGDGPAAERGRPGLANSGGQGGPSESVRERLQARARFAGWAAAPSSGTARFGAEGEPEGGGSTCCLCPQVPSAAAGEPGRRKK